MNKKFLILCLSAGLAFTSCQKDSVSEEVQTQEAAIAKEKTLEDANGKWHFPDYMEGPSAEFHTPEWTRNPGAEFHTPEWTIEAALDACNAEVYNGSQNLNVNAKNSEVAFRSGDSATFLKNLNVGGRFGFCGAMKVENTVNVHRGAEMGFGGELVIGSEEVPADLIINRGAHFHLDGPVYISGNLIVNSFAEINLYGHHTKFVVAGDIIVADNVQWNDNREEVEEHTHE